MDFDLLGFAQHGLHLPAGRGKKVRGLRLHDGVIPVVEPMGWWEGFAFGLHPAPDSDVGGGSHIHHRIGGGGGRRSAPNESTLKSREQRGDPGIPFEICEGLSF